NGKSLKNFEIQASAHVEVNDDVKAALAKLKPEVALYVGGMGHKDKNYHKDMMVRRGFGDAANRIQELYLAKRKDEATAAVPDEWVDQKSLVGPPARIKQRYRAWEDSGATSLTVRSKQPEAVEVMAEAARLNRAG
ncbi:MAG: LLM class flavin-dependent oxidoreductase, partial [Hyphomicrobiaceae bacterium]